MRQETEVHFLVATVILAFLSIFKKRQASSPYETLYSVCLSRGQRDVRPTAVVAINNFCFLRDVRTALE